MSDTLKSRASGLFLLQVVGNDNRENDGDDSKDDERKEEADPPLLPCGAGRDNGFIRVTNSGA